MTPDQFAEAWADDPDHLVTFPLRLLNNFSLSLGDKHFLTVAGLPSAAAPCLSFGPKYAEAESFGNILGEDFQIGSNGSGDPVILTARGEVFYLNHDADFDPRYINRDLPTLAESLVRYRALITETVETSGDDAFLEGKIPVRLREGWVEFLRDADASALAEGSMWADEIACWTYV